MEHKKAFTIGGRIPDDRRPRSLFIRDIHGARRAGNDTANRAWRGFYGCQRNDPVNLRQGYARKVELHRPLRGISAPVIAAGTAKSTGGFTTITRDDGTIQWAYNGKPLYGYANDAKAGDTNGDRFDGVWHAANR